MNRRDFLKAAAMVAAATATPELNAWAKEKADIVGLVEETNIWIVLTDGFGRTVAAGMAKTDPASKGKLNIRQCLLEDVLGGVAEKVLMFAGDTLVFEDVVTTSGSGFVMSSQCILPGDSVMVGHISLSHTGD